jgi:hypothetical protein
MPRRMKTTCLVLGVACAACASDPTSSDVKTPTFLPSDASFLKPDVPQCVQQYPDAAARGYPCCQVLAFYSTGDVSKRSGEEGFPGHYELHDDVATGVLFGQSFAFDLSTYIATGQPLIAGQWIPDTAHVENIACEP